MSLLVQSLPPVWLGIWVCLAAVLAPVLWSTVLGRKIAQITGQKSFGWRAIFPIVYLILVIGQLSAFALYLVVFEPDEYGSILARVMADPALALVIDFIVMSVVATVVFRGVWKVNWGKAVQASGWFVSPLPFVWLGAWLFGSSAVAWGLWVDMGLITIAIFFWAIPWMSWWMAEKTRRLLWIGSVGLLLIAVPATRSSRLAMTYELAGVQEMSVIPEKAEEKTLWLEKERKRQAEEAGSSQESIILPSPDALRFLALGHPSFMADMLFIRANAYFSHHLFSDRLFPWLDPYMDTIIALDPNNPKVYEWAGQAVKYGQLITADVIQRSNRYALMGIKRFPDNWAFYRDYGFNTYFEGPAKSEKERERALRDALPYFEIATTLPNSRMDPNFLVALLERENAYEAALSIIYHRYWEASEHQRRAMKGRLARFGKAASARALERIESRWRKRFPYLPVGLFEMVDSGQMKDAILSFSEVSGGPT
jgi:hypothetical protein